MCTYVCVHAHVCVLCIIFASNGVFYLILVYAQTWNTRCLLEHTLFVRAHAVCWSAHCLLEHMLFVGIHAVCWSARCLLEHTLFVGTHAVCWSARCLLEHTLFVGAHTVCWSTCCLLECTVFIGAHALFAELVCEVVHVVSTFTAVVCGHIYCSVCCLSSPTVQVKTLHKTFTRFPKDTILKVLLSCENDIEAATKRLRSEG